MSTVIFPERLYDDLKSFLFSNSPYENGCFLLANSHKRKRDDCVLLVKEIIKPELNSWNRDGEHWLEPSSSFTNHAVVMADMSNSSVLFVHTHPGSLHPPQFSSIDEKSNKKLFRNLSEILPNRPLGSLVFSKNGVYGVIFDGNKIRKISTLAVVGHTISEVSGVERKTVDGSFDRQLRLLGKDAHARLQQMTATIVGVGGTGSAVAVQLARIGVKKLTLVDKDVIDATNVPRVYGSAKKDVGKPKVDVLKKHVRTFSKTGVEAIHADITEADDSTILKESDVIFGCTDNLTSRAMLNDISVQYYIPLIDVGCRVQSRNDGSIDQAICKVQVVTPDDACLWCTGTLDGKIILQESLPEEERRKLSEEGYHQDVSKQPSVVSLTTMAASMAVNKFLSLLGVFGKEYSSRTQIELQNGFMLDDSPPIKKNCVCEKRRGVGDKRKRMNETIALTSQDSASLVLDSSATL
jgi:hypothetical protein